MIVQIRPFHRIGIERSVTIIILLLACHQRYISYFIHRMVGVGYIVCVSK